ncbi:MAG: hypothetical protein HC818_06190, partial [Synechococcaceae cyanobacterium RM1_1_27]|nr:hypothetical protein [Synechococcaceae cyanobacterium RM1_1_27]
TGNSWIPAPTITGDFNWSRTTPPSWPNWNSFPPADLAQVARNLSIRPFWDDLSEIERRRYFREFIHQVLAQSDGAIQITFVFEALLRAPTAVEPGAD